MKKNGNGRSGAIPIEHFEGSPAEQALDLFAPHKKHEEEDRDGTSCKEDLATLKVSDIVAFNSSAERRFVELITALVLTEPPITFAEALQEGAFELNVSIETSKRYLIKHSARRAEFQIVEGVVQLRRKKK